MSVFLCWSGTRSRWVAEALQTAFKKLDLRTFMSPGIEKGSFWFDAVRRNLTMAEAAIVCLTPENTRAAWLHFEAGAVAAKMDVQRNGRSQPRVFPYLFRMNNTQLSGPLAAFQATHADQVDTLRLLRQLLPKRKLAAFERSSGRWWRNLSAALKAAEGRPIDEIVPEVEMMFRRKTFDEPLDDCTNQNWLGRYQGARDTYLRLKETVDEAKQQCHPSLAEILTQLVESVDSYSMTLEAVLLEPRRFKFNDEGKLNVGKGSLVACENKRKEVKRLLTSLADPKLAPVFEQSPRFQVLETFAEKKVVIHRFEAQLAAGFVPPARIPEAVDSSWDFDRIAFYLVHERGSPKLADSVEWLRREIEKTRADGVDASHMPMSYALGPIATALRRNPHATVRRNRNSVELVLGEASKLGRRRKHSRIPAYVSSISKVLKSRLASRERPSRKRPVDLPRDPAKLRASLPNFLKTRQAS